jgi:tRNA 2-thiouridine synthesizing protein B
MLHLIFQSPIDVAVLDRMGRGDAAVFLESAVLGVLQKGQLAEMIHAKLNTNAFYILSEDMAVRGILESEIVPGLEVIDYAGLVKLTVEHTLIQSWC